ncbi:hypothetical protein MRB53_030201 [Persea americana]|uniref:Uncharacterized protein n=1 Tax=Persea americana TaxID=3435 RepID=A0ACC2KKR5_PERAE|nr:hypothetical protein MRB53_030201 [Persea americana]
MDYAFEWVVQNGGIDSESNYPYTGEDGTCNISKEETKVVTIDGYIDVAEKDSALLCAVLYTGVNQIGSAGVSWQATEDAVVKQRILSLQTFQWAWLRVRSRQEPHCRSERLAKYNELLRIEEELGAAAVYAGEKFRAPVEPY